MILFKTDLVILESLIVWFVKKKYPQNFQSDTSKGENMVLWRSYACIALYMLLLSSVYIHKVAVWQTTSLRATLACAVVGCWQPLIRPKSYHVKGEKWNPSVSCCYYYLCFFHFWWSLVSLTSCYCPLLNHSTYITAWPSRRTMRVFEGARTSTFA